MTAGYFSSAPTSATPTPGLEGEEKEEDGSDDNIADDPDKISSETKGEPCKNSAEAATILDEDDEHLNALLFTQTQLGFKLVEAKRKTQFAQQQSAFAKKDRQRDERRQVRNRELEERREEYERKHGRPPVCPRYNRSEECDGTQCKDIGSGRFSHPGRCRDPKHVVRGRVGECVLWHFWDKAKTAAAKKAEARKAGNSQRGTKSSNNGGGYPQRTNNGEGKTGSGNPSARNGKDSAEVSRLKKKLAKYKAKEVRPSPPSPPLQSSLVHFPPLAAPAAAVAAPAAATAAPLNLAAVLAQFSTRMSRMEAYLIPQQ
jgi:hypothetical protein